MNSRTFIRAKKQAKYMRIKRIFMCIMRGLAGSSGSEVEYIVKRWQQEEIITQPLSPSDHSQENVTTLPDGQSREVA